MHSPQHFAIVGAGMAGITCARTLIQAGHKVTVFEQEAAVGGRMATASSPFGGFDLGAQYFTVRDSRFTQALLTVPGVCRPWSANAVRVLDSLGNVVEASRPAPEPHWVPSPDMAALLQTWAKPLADTLVLSTRVEALERDAMDATLWQLRTTSADGGKHVYAGFDKVILALPHVHTENMLSISELSKLQASLADVQVAPCWTLMLAYPQASQPGLGTLGPQWNAALSTHHRIAWLARESSKPGRTRIERWTVQASADWSREHLNDDNTRVAAKLHKAFAEVTGIRAEPSFMEVHRWHSAKTIKPMGKTHVWDARLGVGIAGDWCIGHRVEDAFISGLELALAAA